MTKYEKFGYREFVVFVEKDNEPYELSFWGSSFHKILLIAEKWCEEEGANLIGVSANHEDLSKRSIKTILGNLVSISEILGDKGENALSDLLMDLYESDHITESERIELWENV
jgi:hypothetical protein